MDYLAAKYLHLLGLAVWIGMIPYEAFASKRIVRTLDQRARYRYLAFSNKLRFCQEYPAIVLVFGTGIWLVAIHGLDNLLAQEWFVWKAILLVFLVGAEVYLTHDSIKMEKKCKQAAEAGERANPAEDHALPMIIGTLAILWFTSIAICAVFKHVAWVGIAVVLVATVPSFIAELIHYRRWRSGRYESPDEPVEAASR